MPSASTESTTLLLDAATAAALVGVEPGMLRRWVKRGLPFVRAGAGGRKMYTRRDLERFIERLKQTVEEQ